MRQQVCSGVESTNSSQRNVVDRTPTEAIDTPETAAMFANGVDEPGRAKGRLWHRRHRQRSTASQRGFHCRNSRRTLLSGAVVTNLACLWSPCRCEEALIVITRLRLRGESTRAVHLRSDPGENPAPPVGRSSFLLRRPYLAPSQSHRGRNHVNHARWFCRLFSYDQDIYYWS